MSPAHVSSAPGGNGERLRGKPHPDIFLDAALPATACPGDDKLLVVAPNFNGAQLHGLLDVAGR